MRYAGFIGWINEAAERACVALRETEPDAPGLMTAIRYLNRLGDLLFVMARIENQRGKEEPIEW